MSARRKAALAIYYRLRRQFLRDHPICEHPGCTRAARDVHHKRGRLGTLLCAVEHWAALCRPHHNWVHWNPGAARAMGLLDGGGWA